jgi:Mg-chelatase subunit ChlD
MRLSFIYPVALWLLLLLPVVWVFTLAAQSETRRLIAGRGERQLKIGRWRLRFDIRSMVSLVVRTVIVVALILALAGTQLVQPVDDLTVVFLIDGSDSVTPVQREWALDFINDSLAEQEPDDRVAMVVFGKNALVERTPARISTVSRITSTPSGNRTNIAEAIQLGLALFPADTNKRLVLFSDGEENAGRAVEAARLLSVREVSLDVVPLPREQGNDVLVTALDAPDTASEGQSIPLQVQIQSDIETTGQLQVFADNELVNTQQVDISDGTTTVSVRVPGNDSGFHRYEVRLEAQGDTQGINNRAAAFTTIEGPPRVLLVTTNIESAVPLQNVLQASGAEVEVVEPDLVPSDQTRLREYAAVVLVDVLSHNVPRSVQEALPVYVSEQGGSLAMIGGEYSFGAGGWRRTPIAEVLPVKLERKDVERRPDIGLVLVIDRSGSMSESGGTGMTKLDLAKEAVYQSTLGLENNDQIGVVAFNDFGSWILPVQKLPDLMNIVDALGQFIADGGTDIRSGIEPAAQALEGVDAKVRHVILLTDGQASSNYADLIAHMHNHGITISIVSIGKGANPELRQIAEIGGGRFYQVNTIADVPGIFLSETVRVAGRDIVEEQFMPLVAIPAPIVRNIEQFPPLYGYNATEPRLAARTILVAPDNKPLLAQWQYGLGSSVAWTSDLKGKWAQEWLRWERFPQFGNDLLNLLIPPEQAEGLVLETRTEGDRAILELSVQDDGRPIEGVGIEGRLLDPEDQGSALSFTQTGAGRYRSVVSVDEPGVYLAQVAVVDEDGQPLGSVSSGMVVAYSPEYSTQRSTPQLMGDLAAIANGRESPPPPEIFAPVSQDVGTIQEVALPLLWLALVLWPVDIALRRLLLRTSDIREVVDQILRPLRRQRQPQPAEGDATMARLMAARDRARRKQEKER